MGPVHERLDLPRVILGTPKDTSRVYGGYIKIPGLGAHARGHGFNLGLKGFLWFFGSLLRVNATTLNPTR